MRVIKGYTRAHMRPSQANLGCKESDPSMPGSSGFWGTLAGVDLRSAFQGW